MEVVCVVEEEGAGKGGEEVVGGAGTGDRHAQEAGKEGKVTAVGREGITTHWNPPPVQMPTATW